MSKSSKKSPARKVVSAKPAKPLPATGNYTELIGDISALLETTRRQSIRVVNAFMTATYWEIGRRIVEFEQGGKERAVYGAKLLLRISADLTAKFGRGFSQRNLLHMRLFYLITQPQQISQTLSAKSAFLPKSIENQQITVDGTHEFTPEIFWTVSRISADAPISQTVSAKSDHTPEICQTPAAKSGDTPISATVSRKSPLPPFTLAELARVFPLPWSHYVLLCSQKDAALVRYATDALPDKLLVRDYLTALPAEEILAAEVAQTRKQLERRKA